MQKKDTLKQITEDLHRGDVYRAIEGWFDNYHPISTTEFLQCVQEWTSEELLVILEDKLSMLQHAVKDIKQHITELP